jgi:hypothetical protein
MFEADRATLQERARVNGEARRHDALRVERDASVTDQRTPPRRTRRRTFVRDAPTRAARCFPAGRQFDGLADRRSRPSRRFSQVDSSNRFRAMEETLPLATTTNILQPTQGAKATASPDTARQLTPPLRPRRSTTRRLRPEARPRITFHFAATAAQPPLA